MNDNFCKPEENSYNFEEHWNNAYLKTPTKSLGWYEENPEQSISLINECNLLENALIFNAGAGSTTLINKLLECGYSNIIVNDIAASALTDLKNDLTIHKNKKVQFIVDDLTNPTELLNLKNIDLQSFIDEPYDILICYYKNELLQLNQITAASKANLKVGISRKDERLYDLIIDVSLKEINIFKQELKKYLNILNKL